MPLISKAAPRSESASSESVETCCVDAPMNCSTSMVGFASVVVSATVVVVNVGLVDVADGDAAAAVGTLVDV